MDRCAHGVAVSGIGYVPHRNDNELLTTSTSVVRFSKYDKGIGVINYCFTNTRSSPVGIRNAGLHTIRGVGAHALGLHFVRKRDCKCGTCFRKSAITFIGTSAVRHFTSTRIITIGQLASHVIRIAFGQSVPNRLRLGRSYIRGVDYAPRIRVHRYCFAEADAQNALVAAPQGMIVTSGACCGANVDTVLVRKSTRN